MSDDVRSILNPERALGRSAALARNWWSVELRGIFAIIFGVVALFLPGVTIASLLVLFAVYMLADGVFTLISAVRAATHHGRWAGLIAEGLLDLAMGAVALFLPVATIVAIVWVVAFWAVVSGAALLWGAFGLHPTHGRWLLVLGGVISMGWGVLLFLAPVPGVVVLTWWLGVYALLFGIALVAAGLRLRRMHTA